MFSYVCSLFAAAVCRFLLIRFDQHGNPWVAMKTAADGSLEMFTANGPCEAQQVASTCSALTGLAVHPFYEVGGSLRNSLLVFDATEVEVPGNQENDPSFVQGQVVWVDSKSWRIDDLQMTPENRVLLFSVVAMDNDRLREILSARRAQ